MHLPHRHLMGSPIALGPPAIDLLRAGPALRRAQHDHGPARPLREAVLPRLGLDALNVRDDALKRGGHELVHLLRLISLDKVGCVAIATEELVQLLMTDAGQHTGVGDLVPVQVQDGQDHPIGDGVEKFVRVPRGGQRPGFRLAIADHRGHDQVWVVEGRPIRMGQGVPELAALVDRAGRLRGHVAGDATGEGELLEQPLHPFGIGGDVGVDLAVGPLEVGVGDQARPAMPRTSDVDHIEVILLDEPVQVDVEEVQARRRPPVAQQPRLDVLLAERFL